MAPETTMKVQAVSGLLSPLLGALYVFGVLPQTKTVRYAVGGALALDVLLLQLPTVRYAFATATRGAAVT